ncbi:hypothetical protein LWF15_02520 [Kineosporia rhizophila]|uniref:hypothetical protein n=1 Tax=Kineosporia TaxID=49184 RepID=UPI000AC41BD8|nr:MULTISPECIES: hypothetical protein [Kineosporia]MCE0534373.1 hypothetical protein [Kineosporia rhizophila]GLY13922.1 hypothetical protein Kisp01_09380 [Kineosporia sp. NBRC 101677]
MIRIGVAIAGLSAILGSATGVAQAAAADQDAPPALTLSASSVSASRTIRVDAAQLRANTTYELISHQTRTDPSSTDVSDSEKVTVLARVKTDRTGEFSTRLVVPLTWKHDHLIELQKAKGADLVEQAHGWITVTPPRPSLALSTDRVYAGSRAGVVVSGLRAHARYRLFSNKTRANAEDPGIGGSSDDGVLRSIRTDANGRAYVTFTVPDHWAHDHLIEVKWKKGQTANAWLTVLR